MIVSGGRLSTWTVSDRCDILDLLKSKFEESAASEDNEKDKFE